MLTDMEIGRGSAEYLPFSWRTIFWAHADYLFWFGLAGIILIMFIIFLLGMCCRCYDTKLFDCCFSCNIGRWGSGGRIGFTVVLISVLVVAIAYLVPAYSNAKSLTNTFQHNECSILTTASTLLYGNDKEGFGGIKPIVQKMRKMGKKDTWSDFKKTILAEVKGESTKVKSEVDRFLKKFETFRRKYKWQELQEKLGKNGIVSPMTSWLIGTHANEVENINKQTKANLEKMNVQIQEALGSEGAKKEMEETQGAINRVVEQVASFADVMEQSTLEAVTIFSSSFNQHRADPSVSAGALLDAGFDGTIAIMYVVAVVLLLGICAALLSMGREARVRGLARSYFICSIPFVVVMFIGTGIFLVQSVLVTEACLVLESNLQRESSLLGKMLEEKLIKDFNLVNTCIFARGKGSGDLLTMFAPKGIPGELGSWNMDVPLVSNNDDLFSSNNVLKKIFSSGESVAVLLWQAGLKPPQDEEYLSPSLKETETMSIPGWMVGSRVPVQVTGLKQPALDIENDDIFFNAAGQKCTYSGWQEFMVKEIADLREMVDIIDNMMNNLQDQVQKQASHFLGSEASSPLSVIGKQNCLFMNRGFKKIQTATCDAAAPALYRLSQGLEMAALLMWLSAMLMFFWWRQQRSLKRWDEADVQDDEDSAPLLRPEPPHSYGSASPAVPVAPTEPAGPPASPPATPTVTINIQGHGGQ